MVWFKVDDKFWSHPKTLMTKLDAIGLWTLTGSWCSQHLTNGRIPDGLLWKISPEKPSRTRALAAELAESGLWSQDGDDWVFHQWLDHNPSKERVEEERAAGRERRRRYEERKATVTQLRAVSGDPGTRSSHVPGRVRNSDPTRPDPTVVLDTGPTAGVSTTAAASAGPCPHGADSPARCAICRRTPA